MICPFCGKDNSENYKFCNGCGYNLSLAASINSMNTPVAAPVPAVSETSAPAVNGSDAQPATEPAAMPVNTGSAQPAAPAQSTAAGQPVAPAVVTPAANTQPSVTMPAYNRNDGYTQQPQSYYNAPAQSCYNAPAPTVPPEYEPIGAWMYCLWGLLFSIPLVGFILLIVFSCGGTQNINLRNYARSHFCTMLIAFVIFVLMLIFFLTVGVSVGSFAAGY